MVVGAVVGAPVRYLADLAVQSRHDSVFPWGTLAVNAAGSLVRGAVAGALRRPVVAAPQMRVRPVTGTAPVACPRGAPSHEAGGQQQRR